MTKYRIVPYIWYKRHAWVIQKRGLFSWNTMPWVYFTKEDAKNQIDMFIRIDKSNVENKSLDKNHLSIPPEEYP